MRGKLSGRTIRSTTSQSVVHSLLTCPPLDMPKGPGGVICFPKPRVPPEPTTKRAIVFVDDQNLFHAVRESFGYTYPNYDVLALAITVCTAKGWTLAHRRDPSHRPRPGPVDQDRVRLSAGPHDSKPPRHQQDRLDSDQPRDVRRLS